ncbi:thiamine biosynthesis lipoprotein [Pseudooceanicola nitratireducens]|jgi:thiamine biosynthesis lipoprotein|uniref:FAD:protein FMN transferase n=1 Tax=Pseudooceanicola nitratireducens TaxID=517719 RepID=A0A1I1J7B3_9RHOB|nr:FAD:protein FMN transferase [Pseudooceanicola nitratireducens]SEJ29728.1 thiamine biosynthesis lipoprotein [Pseudooceanicola nitratireducens]SFC44265.1 thiamine biosynthesis lipoprotein [Pseudooceanicola nitratireducens]
MTRFSRRRFIAMSAATLAAGRASAAGREVAYWRGQALGARAEIAVCGISQAEAASLFDGLELELSRIESLFSLYRTDSALAQLNRDQILRNPDPAMLHLLSEARAVFTATEGAFDPTVQPLFDLHARAFGEGRRVGADEVQHARRRVGFQHVSLSPQAIRFQRGGMALTLNGIAQGYATDRLASLLKSAGLRHILVNAGEIRALGDGQGQGWRVSIPGGRTVTLKDHAIATSDVVGTLVDPAAGIGHIFDPRRDAQLTSGPASICHDSAAIADAASTAAVLMSPSERDLLRPLGAKIVGSAGIRS